jgi:hypothetical protein
MTELAHRTFVLCGFDSTDRCGDLAVRFETEVLGVTVRVEKVNLNAPIRSWPSAAAVANASAFPPLDLPLLSPPPAGWEWIEAYRRWAHGGS